MSRFFGAYLEMRSSTSFFLLASSSSLHSARLKLATLEPSPEETYLGSR